MVCSVFIQECERVINKNFVLYSLPNSLTQLKALVELTLNDLSLSCLPDDIGK